MPDIIQLLPDSIANQIAAGEVIQRPASAVKELIENAIDSGADTIQLFVKDAGKTLIQVIDNGCGMSITDARMSFERHATSKIRKAEDLFAIRSMGFRGEALASIAAIAQVELKTRRHDDELGTCVLIEGSTCISQEPTSCAIGTTISVKNLFYNTPARRNFLKSNPVEMRHIIDEFQRTALAKPGIAFLLSHDENEIFHLQPGSLKQRIVHLFGNTYNEKMVPVEEHTSIIELKGYIGKPEYAKKTRGEQFFFINNRYIKDPYLNHAVIKAYEDILPSDSYPLYVLFIDINPAEIDINVHPTKTEIKYRDEKSIYAIIRSAVKRSLGRYHVSPTLDFNQESAFSQMFNQSSSEEITPPEVHVNPNFNPFKNDINHARTPSPRLASQENPNIPRNWESLYTIVEAPSAQQQQLQPYDETSNMHVGGELFERKVFQIHHRFLVSQIKSGFIVVDQQAAHERILYERFLQQLDSHQGVSQQSLFPKTVSLNASDFELAKGLLPDMGALGFQVREFGKNTFVVEGVPADISAKINEVEMLERLIEGYKKNHALFRLNKKDNLARTLAKNAAIKPGTALSQEEMNALIDNLFACLMPNVSLQGKPIILTFTTEELLHKFDK